MTTETVLLAPLLVVLLLFVVHVGRAGAAHLRLISAADHAARAASQVHPRNMESIARAVADANLRSSEVECVSMVVEVVVDVESDDPTVRVDIACRLDTSGLGLLGPLDRIVTASSTEVVDRWRVDL